MLSRSIKFVAFGLFFIFWVTAIAYGMGRGSAANGYVRDGRYFLSLGHGAFRETDAQHYASVQHDERILRLACVGMFVSGVTAVYIDRMERGNNAIHTVLRNILKGK